MKRAIGVAALTTFAALAASLVSPATAAVGDCGQPQSTGTSPKTSDALAALKSAVGSPSACDTEPCVCDVNANGAINTTDALLILRDAVGQPVTLACDCGCAVLGGAAALASERSVPRGASGTPQIEIKAKFVEVSENDVKELGFDWLLSSVMSVPPAPGGTSGYDTNLAVSSNVTGGPTGFQYFLYSAHRPEGALPVLNKNFVSQFTAIKTFFVLPTDDCVTFPEDAISEPQNHPGGDPVENVPAGNGGYGDVESVAHGFLTDEQVSTILTSLQGNAGTEVFTAPTVNLYPGQSVFHMIDDIEPDVDDFVPAFKARIQDVTSMPFGNFTGPVVDLEPTIDGDNVRVKVRIGSQIATFFFSTAFLVDGTPTDAEIPLHQRSTTTASVVVPSGQTLLIGGLKRSGNPDIQEGLPFLGNVPLVGALFTHKRLDAVNNRLLILVTPRILDAE